MEVTGDFDVSSFTGMMGQNPLMMGARDREGEELGQQIKKIHS